MSASLGSAFWWLWGSSGSSNLGDGIVKVGAPLVAIQYTRSPMLVASIGVAVSLPWLCALPAGALVDRVDRRRVMLGANGTRAGLVGVLALAIVLDIGSIWLLYAVVFALGLTETIYDTAAQAILPQVVRRDQLSRANSRLFAVELTANEFVGPPLAGLLIAGGAALAFGIPAALWGLAIVALFLVPGRFRVQRTHRSTVRADINEGLRYLRRHQILRTLAVMTGGFNIATEAMMAILVLYAVGPGSAMGLAEQAYGIVLAAFAGGALGGSFVAARIERVLGRSRALAVALLSGALSVGIPAVTANPWAVGAGFFLAGVGLMLWNVIVVSLRQRIIPHRLLGRVSSSYRLVAWGSRPLGAAAGGVLAQLFGLRAVFAVMALLILSTLTGLWVVTDERITAAEREAGHA
ncbi:MFS transporter [Nocardia brasiliensis]|uniref:Major facilitator transporter n=1 Tax=Nocardia brasiliensis (strain ATCC 700358 / HUJEG-1) TaxID=1133849 RepID=K0F0M0_NOCB7|nr:MFS transporter [Nocardia brasiliensis]AFU02954.1 major facilitator transporter [Nocardia brasiliensis ATCC 700358]OCF86026.1 MFS transporter [Nocardia brasiliensis]